MSPLSKSLSLLLLFAGIVFSTAPEWIAEGIELEYAVGGDKVVFSVVERTSTEIRVEIRSGTSVRTAVENTSIISGQFWFDQSLLENASKYQYIEEFLVNSEGSQTFIGERWDTLTLETTLSGAKTTRIYDRKTGLMLKQTVSAEGAPTVTLLKHNMGGQEPVPEPEDPESVIEENEPPAINKDPAETAVQEEQENKPETAAQPQVTTITPTAVQTSNEEQPKAKKPCIPAAMLLALAAFVATKK
ncbi:hypothetical protein JXA56_01550 [Candidatus Micrarchaeota archaeon]|nr:hypothetical protein [Candidatus Micrarchaeota archaeon]